MATSILAMWSRKTAERSSASRRCRVAAALAKLADSPALITHAATATESATRDGRSRRLDIHTSSSIVYCPWPRIVDGPPSSAALALRPLCLAQERLWCEHDFPGVAGGGGLSSSGE